jgi:hypothetical protein
LSSVVMNNASDTITNVQIACVLCVITSPLQERK